MAQFAGNAHWAAPSALFAHRARSTPLKCENPVLPLGEETAVQAIVGSIVWAFRRLKKPRSGEMSARGYAHHSVCPQLFFFLKSLSQSTSSTFEVCDNLRSIPSMKMLFQRERASGVCVRAVVCLLPGHRLLNLRWSIPVWRLSGGD